MPTRITVLGSANMDLVVSVDRAPQLGETVTGTAFRTVPGGKGANQALAAARVGGEVRFAGAVGDDAHGAQIRALLTAAGIDVSALDKAAAPTGTAHITVDGSGANSIVVVPGANGTVQALSDRHRAAIAGADVLLLQLELPMAAVVEGARCARMELELEPRLLACLPHRCVLEAGVRRLDVAARLQHPAELRMRHQAGQLAGLVEHERRGGEVRPQLAP